MTYSYTTPLTETTTVHPPASRDKAKEFFECSVGNKNSVSSVRSEFPPRKFCFDRCFHSLTRISEGDSPNQGLSIRGNLMTTRRFNSTMSIEQDQNGSSLPQFDIEQQKEARATLYLDRRDSSGSSTEGSDYYGASTSKDGNTAELLHGFQRKLRFVWSSSVSETSAADTPPTNESSPLMNPLKPKPGRRTSSGTWLNQAWRMYEKNLNQRPVITKAITSGCLTLVGDFVGQCIEQQRLEHNASENGNFDLVRLVKFSSMGIFLQAPVTHYFYLVLDYYLPPTPYPWTPTTFLKLACDQLIYAPIFTFMVILYLGICGGSSWHGVQEQLEVQFWRTLLDNWKLWVPATVINMAYVAPPYRVGYCNIVFFFWSIYLSLTLNTAG